jgi:C4-type Zn-finger protein
MKRIKRVVLRNSTCSNCGFLVSDHKETTKGDTAIMLLVCPDEEKLT